MGSAGRSRLASWSSNETLSARGTFVCRWNFFPASLGLPGDNSFYRQLIFTSSLACNQLLYSLDLGWTRHRLSGWEEDS